MWAPAAESAVPVIRVSVDSQFWRLRAVSRMRSWSDVEEVDRRCFNESSETPVHAAATRMMWSSDMVWRQEASREVRCVVGDFVLVGDAVTVAVGGPEMGLTASATGGGVI